MSRQAMVVLAVLALLVGVVALGVWLGREDGKSGSAPVREAGGMLPSVAGDSATPAGVPAERGLPARDVPLPDMPDQTLVDGVEALREARLAGDDRAPAIVRDEGRRETPTAAELADPDAYQRYEARQNERLYRSYIKAAEAEVPKLQEQLARGKQAGLTPEQIAEGEEKLRRIEEMRNQLMSDHPELTRPPAP